VAEARSNPETDGPASGIFRWALGVEAGRPIGFIEKSRR
jgi:hypothetical protein